jgi:hypothetical protein
MDDPVLSGVSDEKLEFLTNVIQNSKGMNPQQMLTYFMKESGQASQRGMIFSDEETAAILKILTADMSPSDKKKVETIQKMVSMISKKMTQK